MKRLMFAFMVAFMAVPSVFAEHTRVTNPNALSVEGLGKALMWSVQYDRMFNDDLAAGFGFGTVGLNLTANGASSGLSTSVVPIYMHYYFVRDSGSPFAMLGATVVLNSTAADGLTSNTGGLQFSSSPVIPEIGLGYEVRTDAGAFFRATAYGMFGRSFSPWFGATFGTSF